MSISHLVLFSLLLRIANGGRPSVKLTDNTLLFGTTEKIYNSDKEFQAFKGIRYAQAPLGNRRFQAPVPIQYEEENIDAIKYGSSCPQKAKSGSYFGNEDCLFLNVFVPKNGSGPLPVMVYLHGGSFTMGDGAMYGPDYFMNRGHVIIVTLNYRIGVLGFLSLEDDTIGGNMGIKDQLEALRWVKKYIKAFGGDENSLTIFGNSAGGISVLSLMMATHKEPDLFHKAISQSAPMINSPFMHLTHRPYYYSSLYATELGCDIESTTQILLCLRDLTAEELILNQHMFEKLFELPNPWKPIEDFTYASKPLFKMSFLDSLNGGYYNKVPLLIGGTSEESACLSSGFFENNEEKFQELTESFEILGATLLLGIDEADVTEEDLATANIINMEYFHEENVTYSSENIDKLIKMLTDVHFLGPIDKQVQLITNSSRHSIYYYNYRYRGSQSTGIKGLGASHGDEIFLLFKIKDITLTAEDKKVSEILLNYWTNFAMNGSPDTRWKSVSNKISPPFAPIDGAQELVMRRDSYFNERMAFISSTNEIISSYRKFDLESHPAILSVMDREVEEDVEENEEGTKRDEL